MQHSSGIVKSLYYFTHYSVQHSRWVSRWSSTHLHTIFSHRDLCYGYRITDTWRTRDILLLVFLVPTCHLSMPTFSVRFFATYYCGWWCRGSTHVQKWWHAWTACYKNLWESWPAYEMGPYMDGESTEATRTIKAVPESWSLDTKPKIQGTQWAYML